MATKKELSGRDLYMNRVWEVVKRAMEWHQTRGGGVLKRAVAAVELGKACTALEEFEKGLE